MAEKVLCKVLGHRVNRSRIGRAEGKYLGRCRRCNAMLERAPDGWRLRADPG